MLGVAAVIVAHLALAWTWLGLDEGLPDGDVLGVLGAVELFWGQCLGEGARAALWAAVTQDFGEYPPLHYAVTGVAAAWAGVTSLDGDGPARVGLLWGALALAGTGWLGWEASGGRRGPAAVWSAALLAGSPLWAATQRHLLIEDALCAFVALCAAALAAARRRGGPGWWAVAGLFAAAALLTKQTALLALGPLGAVVAVRAWRSRDRRGVAVAALVAALGAGPWYLGRLAVEGAYLLGSAEANPDAAGPLRQAAFYPLVIAQQVWAPVVWLALGAVVFRVRERLPGWLLLTVALGAALLLGIPKKYPRLLLALLPLGSAALGVGVAAAGVRKGRGGPIVAASSRIALAGLLAGSAVGAALLSPPLTAALGGGEVGLGGMDERCPQRWVEPPLAPGIPWGPLLAAIRQGAPSEEARGAAPRVGAVRWPAPPCAYQTTHDLGEHLRIRARRADLPVEVDAGASYEQAGGWTDGPPDLLVSDGPLVCGARPGGDPCGGARYAEIGRFPSAHPRWPLDLRLLRRAP